MENQKRLISENLKEAERVINSLKDMQPHLKAFHEVCERIGVRLDLWWPQFSKGRKLPKETILELLEEAATEGIPSATAIMISDAIKDQALKNYNQLEAAFEKIIQKIPIPWDDYNLKLSSISFTRGLFYVSDASREEIMDRCFRLYVNNPDEEKAIELLTAATKSYGEFNDFMKMMGLNPVFGRLNLIDFCLINPDGVISPNISRLIESVRQAKRFKNMTLKNNSVGR